MHHRTDGYRLRRPPARLDRGARQQDVARAVAAPATTTQTPPRAAGRGAIPDEAPVTTGLRPARVPQALRRGITVEASLYILVLALAAITRFWDLGSKALHHDESLHAYYSWLFATGEGYRHHPLMHGPFLFHANALVYLLFGDSDATSRYMPAFFGVVLVGLPYLLRGPRHLGRWGALAASFLLLISPAILYQSRYIRHDIYTITGTLLFFICIVRYLENPERKWLVIGAASASFLLTNHEIVFAIFAIFGLFLYGALLLSRCRVWYRSRPDLVYQLLAIHAGALLLALVLAKLSPVEYRERIFNIPWDSSGISSPPPTRENQLNYYKDLLVNPLVWAFIALIVGFVSAVLWTLSRIKAERAESTGWVEPLLGDAPGGSVEAGVRHAWQDRAGLALAAGIAVAIFVALFTSLFTNLNGLISSTVATDGTLLYWLGQHDYRRGEQPWFYFLLLMPQYEFLAVTFGGALAGLTIWRALSTVLRRGSTSPRFFFRLFLSTWFILIFLGLSYAGEKMPWLVVHISLPATLLAAAVVGGVAERLTTAIRQHESPARQRAFGWAEGIVFGVIMLAGAGWIALASRMTFGQFVPDTSGNRGGWRRTVTAAAVHDWWLLAIPPAVILIALLIALLWRGPVRTGLVTLTALTVALALLQVHVGWHLSYREPDVPRDMLIYTQTSPDVTRLMDEIQRLSEETTGGKDLVVWFDSTVQWPMWWYLRDYPKKRYFGSSLASVPSDAPIVLVGGESSGAASALEGYTAQEYVLRWWFPEETYRDFAIAPELRPGRSAWQFADQPHGPVAILRSIGETLSHQLTPDGQLRLYRLLMYRDLDWKIGQTNFTVYIRNDLLPYFNGIRY